MKEVIEICQTPHYRV